MQDLASTLTRFSVPDLTAEQWARHEAEIEAEAQRQAMKEAATRVLVSGIPPEFADAEVEDERVARWLEHPGYGLLLKGLPGRGKTHEGAAALKALATEGSILFVAADYLVRGYAACLDSHESQVRYLARFKAADFLMIDDLGKEEDRFGSFEAVFSVIDRRGQRMRPTIVTTNLDGRGILDRYAGRSRKANTEALISRLSRYEAVNLDGGDRRRG